MSVHLIDTHCHLNIMVKKKFDIPLTTQQIEQAAPIIEKAEQMKVKTIINVGTSLIESLNCIDLAKAYPGVYATVGIHPNDLKQTWQDDLKELKKLLKNKAQNKIVGIGEIGMDKHYKEYNLARQKDAFKAQIELALENNLAIVVHTRQATEETLSVLEEFNKDISRCVIHCFSEKKDFADTVIDWGFYIGLGGTITYPKNEYLRDVATTVSLQHIVLETDAPFLPPQIIRGKQNSPEYIMVIAQFLADIRGESLETVAQQTTKNARTLFLLPQ